MKQISDKFKKNNTVIVALDSEEEATTSRRIYQGDYEAMRKIAFYENKTITEVLESIYQWIKPMLLEKGPGILPDIDVPTDIVEKHKSVRIPIDFNEFIKDYAKKKTRTKMTSKKLLSACIALYLAHKEDSSK